MTILAKLSGISVTDAIRTGIENHIATLAANPDVSARAETVLADIDREASEQRAAIASLFGDTGTTTTKRGSSGSKA